MFQFLMHPGGSWGMYCAAQATSALPKTESATPSKVISKNKAVNSLTPELIYTRRDPMFAL